MMTTTRRGMGMLLLMSGFSVALSSCWFDDHIENTKYCYVHFINNSDCDVYVAGMTVASPKSAKGEITDTIFGYLSNVKAFHESSDLSLWYVDYDNEDEVSWETFFNRYHLGTLEILVFKNLENLGSWLPQMRDSLVLKRYSFRLPDLVKEKSSVTIEYP